MIKLMNSREGFYGPVNIGNPGKFSIKELAEIVIDMTNSKSNIIFGLHPQDNPTQRNPDISFAKMKG